MAQSAHQIFNDYRGKAGKVPPETCPYINEVQEALAEARAVIIGAKTDPASRSKGRKALTKASRELEKVRNANSSLRELSWHWRSCSEDLVKASKEKKKR